jgi:hypothetical protein
MNHTTAAAINPPVSERARDVSIVGARVLVEGRLEAAVLRIEEGRIAEVAGRGQL